MEWFLLLLIWPIDGEPAAEPVRYFISGIESKQDCEARRGDATSQTAARLAAEGETQIRIRYRYECIGLGAQKNGD